MILTKKNKGQTALEYTVLIIVVMGALLTAQTYVKRGIQGRWKESVDQLGDQYDPRTAETSLRQTMEASTNTLIITMNTTDGYWTRRTDDTISTERKTGYESVGSY